MFRFSDRISFVKTAALLVALAAALAPAAQAADKSDSVDRQLPTIAALDVRSPDRTSPAPQWAPRAMPTDYAQAGAGSDGKRYGIPRATASHYAAAGVTLHAQGTQPVDFRSADTRDAAIGRYPDSGPVLIAAPSGFDWGDATVGMGATFAALLLAGAVAIGVRHHKRVAVS